MNRNRSPAATARLFLTLAFVAGAACADTPTSDEDQVVEALRTLYVAATNDDLALFHTVAAPDFYAFDVGKRFEGDALMELIKDLHAAGSVYVWQVTEPEVRVHADTALITYVNRGSVPDASGRKDMAWLESAFLRKDEGRWRIHFLHSTRVP
jgi:ketosteroid isomerase-like protein